MPVMDGYTATEEIRKVEDYQNVPIVAMTGHSPEEDHGKCLIAGCNEYLAKPIRKKDVRGLLCRLFPERPVDAPVPEGQSLSGKRSDLFSEQFLDPETREVAEEYLNDFDERLAQSKVLLENRNQKELKDWAHNLKGVTGNLGLKAIHLLAKDLSSLCKTEEFSWGTAECKIQGLKKLMLETRKAVKKMDKR